MLNSSDQKSSSAIKSADRVLDVLELLCRRGNSASHTDIAFSLDIPKSSLSGLLKNLISRNYLEKNHAENTYLLGPAFYDLIKQGENVIKMPQIAQAQLNWMTEKTKEASAFYVFKGDHIERMLGAEASYPLSYRMPPNVKFSLYSAAAGKAVLHALPELERENYLQNLKIKPNTDRTVTTKKELRARLIEDTENGVTFSYGENSVGVIALAVPILGENLYPLGALSIVVPEVRFNAELKQLCMEVLMNAGKKIEFELRSS